MRSARRLATLLALLATPAAALTPDLPPSANLALEMSEPLASHALATGPWSEGHLPTLPLEGEITRQIWRIPASDRTTLQLLAPIRDQIAAQGFRVLLDCEGEGCGGFDFRSAIEVLPPPAMFVDLVDFRYLSAERGDEALSLLVSRSGDQGFVQLIRVRSLDPDMRLPTVPGSPPDVFATRIEAEGRVVLDGVVFATGSAELASGGEATLSALAAYLTADPDRRVALVGHTDAQGPLASNVALSKRRAQAVADRLVARHGVDRSQITAEGMGWLAPLATNLTPEGRETNRRVEAVVLP